MSLRDDLIEAGARAFVEEAKKNPVDHRNALGGSSWLLGQPTEEVTEALLDAVLDALADRADEWALETIRNHVVDVMGEDAEAMVAVLRGPVSGSDSTMENQ